MEIPNKLLLPENPSRRVFIEMYMLIAMLDWWTEERKIFLNVSLSRITILSALMHISLRLNLKSRDFAFIHQLWTKVLTDKIQHTSFSIWGIHKKFDMFENVFGMFCRATGKKWNHCTFRSSSGDINCNLEPNRLFSPRG